MKNKQKESAFKLVYLLIIITPVFLFHLERGGLKLNYYTIGQILGFVGLSLLGVQFLLTTRMPLLEKGVGLDKITHWHKQNAKLFTLFVFLHPLLLYLPDLNDPLAIIRAQTIYHLMGLAALILVLFTVVVSIYSEKLNVDYEIWKILHLAAYAIGILALGHALFLGSDVAQRGLLFYWWGLIAGVIGFSAFYRLILRRVMGVKKLYEVVDVAKRARNVVDIKLKPLNGALMNYQPGQFAFVTFRSNDLPEEEHHFTLSSSPTEDFLMFSVKALGDFTAKLQNIKVGAKAEVEGPFGTFSNVNMEGPFVFLAGGIGITPIRNMLKYMADEGHKEDSLLLYGNRTEDDIAFKEELDELSKEEWLEVVHVLSAEKKEGYPHGFIDKDLLEEKVDDFEKSKFFIVGPEPMMEAMKKILKDKGVEDSQIHTELFKLK